MKKYIFSIVFVILGLVSFIVYMINGSYVNSDGMIVESFGFIPLGYLLIFIGLISAIIIAIVTKFRMKSKKI